MAGKKGNKQYGKNAAKDESTEQKERDGPQKNSGDLVQKGGREALIQQQPFMIKRKKFLLTMGSEINQTSGSVLLCQQSIQNSPSV